MGGGGSYYDRDVSDRSDRTSRGYTRRADKVMSRKEGDPLLSPMSRKIKTDCKSPVVFILDVTGSMGALPKILYDKWPNIVGQIMQNGYLEDPEVSLAAVGDTISDLAPIQVCDFSSLQNLDKWLKRIWIERGGGGNSEESYEMAAWYYANRCDMIDPENPILIITGDQRFYEEIDPKSIRVRFIPSYTRTGRFSSKEVFRDLIKAFKGNVFHVHRRHKGDDTAIVAQWAYALGQDRVITFPEDLAIGDIILGIFALVSGSRTLDQYCEDMRNRKNVDTGEPEPQNEERISMVFEALSLLERFKSEKGVLSPQKKIVPAVDRTIVPAKSSSIPGPWRPSGNRPGRI